MKDRKNESGNIVIALIDGVEAHLGDIVRGSVRTHMRAKVKDTVWEPVHRHTRLLQANIITGTHGQVKDEHAPEEIK